MKTFACLNSNLAFCEIAASMEGYAPIWGMSSYKDSIAASYSYGVFQGDQKFYGYRPYLLDFSIDQSFECAPVPDWLHIDRPIGLENVMRVIAGIKAPQISVCVRSDLDSYLDSIKVLLNFYDYKQKAFKFPESGFSVLLASKNTVPSQLEWVSYSWDSALSATVCSRVEDEVKVACSKMIRKAGIYDLPKDKLGLSFPVLVHRLNGRQGVDVVRTAGQTPPALEPWMGERQFVFATYEHNFYYASPRVFLRWLGVPDWFPLPSECNPLMPYIASSSPVYLIQAIARSFDRPPA